MLSSSTLLPHLPFSSVKANYNTNFLIVTDMHSFLQVPRSSCMDEVIAYNLLLLQTAKHSLTASILKMFVLN